jgi:translation initiation factor IF-2
MSEVTVTELASVVGTPVERLLGQMKEAGLPHNSVDQAVSDNDKKTLLAFLKNAHGESTASPKKITLKRKTTGTLRAAGGQGKKTVAVEVRKKRTYVKRERPVVEEPIVEELTAPIEAAVAPEPVLEVPVVEEAAVEIEKITEESPPSEVKVEAPVEIEAEVAVEVKVEAPVEVKVEAKVEIEDEFVAVPEEDDFDPEKIRLAAAERRIQENATLRDAHAEKIKAKEAKEAAAVAAVAAKNAPAVTEEAKPAKAAKAAKKGDSLKRLKVAPSAKPEDERKERRPKRKKGQIARGQTHSLNLSVDDEYEEESGGVARGKRRKGKKVVHPEHSKHGFEKPVEKKVYEVEIPEAINIGELASKMSIKGNVVVRTLMNMGTMATINQTIDRDTATLVVEELGHAVKYVSDTQLEDALDISTDHEGEQVGRAPVVTVMGHVDHGKTSLLDFIRNSKVATGEAGGITQHIGAYHVETDKGMISFLDTPGHAAFTAMRARGAQSTDIVILVVAADDGVMPQTEEAIQHSKAAGVPMIVAINKMDKEQADPERVKNELSAKEVIPEDWGGDVQFIPVSAHSGAGINELLDAILLQAEILELTAAVDVPAKGLVIESSLDKGRGPVANILIQEGTLRQGDVVLAGQHYGRVRAMLDEDGKPIKEAGPSIPVQILGLSGTASAGDVFVAVENEKQAREVASHREIKDREAKVARQQAIKLENMFSSMGSDEVKSLNIVVKADVRGSLEAIQSSLLELGNEEVEVNIVASGVGAITGSDISLAATSGAVVFGFNVRADATAKQVVETEGVDLRYYAIIYDLLDDVKQALEGMLSPELREEIVGVAEVRDVFNSPKFGSIAGSMVIEGTIHRSKPIRVLRDEVVIYQGELESLRRFKDDVQEVRNGMECGIGVKNYTDVRPGDKIEVFDTREIARTL